MPYAPWGRLPMAKPDRVRRPLYRQPAYRERCILQPVEPQNLTSIGRGAPVDQRPKDETTAAPIRARQVQ